MTDQTVLALEIITKISEILLKLEVELYKHNLNVVATHIYDAVQHLELARKNLIE